ncbi:Intron-binding protein aquarius [Smittium culicis]|uniref:Intron-binding protein aquarius n=1 Tax=Smittium culicis TaxID=133412 RepID=A0A1R1YFV4_9FUNG|nr:Intron-binding protein aquarius [Smittium culicis]
MSINSSQFASLINVLDYYINFPLELFNGTIKTQNLNEICLASISKLSSAEYHDFLINKLAPEEISCISELIGFDPESLIKFNIEMSPETINQFIFLVFKDYFSIPSNLNKSVQNLPLYPTESEIFDDSLNKDSSKSSHSPIFQSPIAISKLNMQFLTLYDYLFRNFNLFQYESTYQIRLDIEDSIRYLDPQKVDDSAGYDNSNSEIVFSGWSRMACSINSFEITEIMRPKVGSLYSSAVYASVDLDLSQFTKSIREEWELNLKPLDVVFLISVRSTSEDFSIDSMKSSIIVRGCQIESLIGIDGKPFDDSEKQGFKKEGDNSFKLGSLRLLLDPIQYQKDISSGQEHIYSSFNLVLRRKSKENNFKSVLSTVRDLMKFNSSVPKWFKNIFLGFGDPKSATCSPDLDNFVGQIDFQDTFLDLEHIKSTFPDKNIVVDNNSSNNANTTYSLNFLGSDPAPSSDSKIKGSIVVKSTERLNMGPYSTSIPKRNVINFTPTQVKAISSAQHEGLTMIIGPPGSGKTDVAVQIISNLYHSFPTQKILLITHSNQALNQLFDKILGLDIEQRHLLRLGHGEEDVNSNEIFTKAGRVDSFLLRRTELLEKVTKLAESLSVPGDVGYTCETAGYFFISEIMTRWNIFEAKIKQTFDNNQNTLNIFNDLFPFREFFSDVAETLFSIENSFERSYEISQGCFRFIKSIFTELEGMRPFELLKSSYDRSNYLLLHEAKIIAMTCTHAALKRPEFAKLGFSYDSVIFEEAAQILEIESFIPLVLHGDNNESKLKRIIMIGDHNQLPPVVKNSTLKQSCNLEQSMFTRLIRLGVPAISLDKQGRSRPEITNLFRWAYNSLGDLQKTHEDPEFKISNPGFAFNYQLIDVNSQSSKGESEPSRHFYQNIGEAEYAAAIYQYMRLLGYPKDKICILTTYNGQKSLLYDVFNLRCGSNSLFGVPKISTVDQFQGMQSDYIILSLVRTKHIGHIRDFRRLIVAMSRARLGLYVLCNYSLFKDCPEISKTFEILGKRPLSLRITENESYPGSRFEELFDTEDSIENSKEFSNLDEFGNYVYEMTISKISD